MCRFIVILLLFLFSGEGKMLSMDFKRLSIGDGLSNSIVFSISQNDQGLIWFATKSGVDSYDGNQFNHFDLKTGSTSFSSQGRQILYDNNDNLWVGSSNGLF